MKSEMSSESVSFLTESTQVGYSDDSLIQKDEELAFTYLPISIFIGVMMCIGLVGNSIAAFIYFFRWGRGSAKYFIGTLAISDLLSSLISMPLELVTYLHPLCFHSDALCKILRFSHALISVSSGLMLMVIAFDRYWQICKIGHFQRTSKYPKTLCVLSFVIGVILGSPAIVMYGVVKVTREKIIWTNACGSQPPEYLQPFASVYRCFLLLIYVTMAITLFVLYYRIAARLQNMPHRKRMTDLRSLSGFQDPPSSPLPVIVSNNGGASFLNTMSKVDLKKKGKEEIPSTEKPVTRSISLGAIDRIKVNSEVRPDLTKRTFARNQMITTLIAITILAIVAYLPNISLIVWSSLNKDKFYLTPFQQLFFNFGLVLHYLSNSFNPFVYGFFSEKFRGQLKIIFRKIIFCVKLRKVSV